MLGRPSARRCPPQVPPLPGPARPLAYSCLQKGGLNAKRAERKRARQAGGAGNAYSPDPTLQEALNSGNITANQITEGQFLTVLFLLFCILILEGLFVGASVRIGRLEGGGASLDGTSERARGLHCCMPARPHPPAH